MTQSRLRLDSTTNLPTVRSFDQLSRFLRGSGDDRECRQISDGMRRLAERIEAIILALRTNRERSTVAPLLVDLLTVLRAHRNQIVDLALPWRGLYEYGGYLQALTNFRVLIGQWLLDGGPRSAELLLTAEDFELVSWRTLGEGMLLIDMYEQWVGDADHAESGLGSLPEPQVQRAIRWWRKLRL
ncbi:hypothetical protein [Ramlibacter sp.]|uniref:hypothetical protein n=1 Tax=Ramlibacter sp. TaxID=1917967 RepID=UPI002C652054|nr:hypothetical protein [Ramlibacter sp.]HWI82656.1 hypothetical protein [Ramlibacter sp.]